MIVVMSWRRTSHQRLVHVCVCARVCSRHERAHTFGTRIGAPHAPVGSPASSVEALPALNGRNHPAAAEGVADRAGVWAALPTGSTLMSSEKTAVTAPKLTSAQVAQDLQCRFTAAATWVRMRLPTHHPLRPRRLAS